MVSDPQGGRTRLPCHCPHRLERWRANQLYHAIFIVQYDPAHDRRDEPSAQFDVAIVHVRHQLLRITLCLRLRHGQRFETTTHLFGP
jgi:hypothetical protein